MFRGEKNPKLKTYICYRRHHLQWQSGSCCRARVARLTYTRYYVYLIIKSCVYIFFFYFNSLWLPLPPLPTTHTWRQQPRDLRHPIMWRHCRPPAYFRSWRRRWTAFAGVRGRPSVSCARSLWIFLRRQLAVSAYYQFPFKARSAFCVSL